MPIFYLWSKNVHSLRKSMQVTVSASLTVDGNICRDLWPDTMLREPKLEVFIRSLLLEIGEPYGRWGRKTVGVRRNGAHQENIVPWIN